MIYSALGLFQPPIKSKFPHWAVWSHLEPCKTLDRAKEDVLALRPKLFTAAILTSIHKFD